MVSTASRKRRVASYIGAGIIPGEGGGVTPLGPTAASFSAGSVSGTLIALITGLQDGETITGVTPNDGRLAIAGSGTQLVVGLSASSAGSIAAVLTSSAGRTLNIAITVTAMVTALQSVYNAGLPPIDLNFADTSKIGATGGLVDSVANSGTAGGVATSTGANRPGTGVTTINGKNVLDMSATHLDLSSQMMACFNGVHSVVAVYRNDEAGTTVRYPWGASAAGVLKDYVALNFGNTANRVYIAAGGGNAVYAASDNKGMSISICRAQLNSTTVVGTKTLYGAFNGDSTGGYSVARVDSVMDAVRIGGIPTATANRLVGKFARFQVFDRVLSFDEQQILEGAHAWDYDMVDRLPVGHPWKTLDPRITPRTYNIWVLGDSMAEGAFLSVKWSVLLAALSGRQVRNDAKGGTTSVQAVDVWNLDERFKDRFLIVRTRRNDGGQGITPAQGKAAIETLVSKAGNRFMVISVCKTYDEYVGGSAEANMVVIDGINADMAASHGVHYLDIQAGLVAQGAPGQTYADATAFARGLVPGQPPYPNRLRFDNTHTNENSQPIEAQSIWSKIQALESA